MHLTLSIPIVRTPRVMQLEGMFDLSPSRHSTRSWSVNLPLDERPWNIGLITGPSGCGKSTIARELFGPHLIAGYDWPEHESIVDAFPSALGIKEITSLLGSVGFCTPPSWLRPFRALSNGEQFRVTIARALAEQTGLAVIDEFTSVVDRTVARIGSAAIAKCVRRRGRQLVAVSCHDDLLEWLQPDWTYEPASGEFSWRSLRRRPEITLIITRVHRAAWKLFQQHHYLSSQLNRSAKCFVGSIDERPIVFSSAIFFPHADRPGWREHRTVCLPDYQGIGIGNALSDFVASLFQATGRPYRSTTANPAMICSRARSPHWKTTRPLSRIHERHQGSGVRLGRRTAHARMTASFEYIGPARPTEARGFGIG